MTRYSIPATDWIRLAFPELHGEVIERLADQHMKALESFTPQQASCLDEAMELARATPGVTVYHPDGFVRFSTGPAINLPSSITENSDD